MCVCVCVCVYSGIKRYNIPAVFVFSSNGVVRLNGDSVITFGFIIFCDFIFKFKEKNKNKLREIFVFLQLFCY